MSVESVFDKRPSDKYRLMIYFAVATILMYSKTLIDSRDMTPEEFYNSNKEVMQRVFDEGLSIMQYELSFEQMMKACYSYLSAKYYPQDVNSSEEYTLK